jgi:hypothetical protein
MTLGTGGADWDKTLPPDRTGGVEHRFVDAVEQMVVSRNPAAIREWLRQHGRAAGHHRPTLDLLAHCDTALYVWCLSAATAVERLTHLRECAANRLIQMGHRELIRSGAGAVVLR